MKGIILVIGILLFIVSCQTFDIKNESFIKFEEDTNIYIVGSLKSISSGGYGYKQANMLLADIMNNKANIVYDKNYEGLVKIYKDNEGILLITVGKIRYEITSEGHSFLASMYIGALLQAASYLKDYYVDYQANVKAIITMYFFTKEYLDDWDLDNKTFPCADYLKLDDYDEAAKTYMIETFVNELYEKEDNEIIRKK